MTGLVLNAGWWWGSVFLVNLPLVLLLIGPRLVPRAETRRTPTGSRSTRRERCSRWSRSAVSCSGIIEGPEWGWTSAGVIGSFVLAAAGTAAFIAWELRATHPMLDPRLFRLRGFAMGSLSITLAFFCMFGTFFLVSQYLQFVHGYSALGTAVRTLPSAAVMILVSPRSPKIVAKIGVRNSVRAGFTLIGLGFIGMSTLDVTTPYWHLAIFLCTMSSGMATLMAPASGMIVASLPLSKAGVGSAVNDVTPGGRRRARHRDHGVGVGIGVRLGDGRQDPGSADPRRAAGAHGGLHRQGLRCERPGRRFEAHPRSPPSTSFMRQPATSFINGSRMAFLLAAGVALVGGLIAGNLIPNQTPAHGSVVDHV